MRCVGGLICGARWLLNRVILYIARWLLTRVALCIVLFLFMVVNNVHFAYFKLFFGGIFFHGEKSGRFSLGKAAATEKRCPVYLWRCRIFFRILPGKVSSSPPFPLECCWFFRGVSKWRGITGPIDWTGIKAKKKKPTTKPHHPLTAIFRSIYGLVFMLKINSWKSREHRRERCHYVFGSPYQWPR